VKRRPLMERVRDYVTACEVHGWRPVFTTEQYLEILTDRGVPEYMHAPGEPPLWRCLYGVPFKVDDTPRPPMPSVDDRKGWTAWQQRLRRNPDPPRPYWLEP